MNTLSKVGLSVSLLLLLTACTAYPTRSGYYPAGGGYGSSYGSYGSWQKSYHGSPGYSEYYTHDYGQNGHHQSFRQQSFYPARPQGDHDERRPALRFEGGYQRNGYNTSHDRDSSPGWQAHQYAQPREEHRQQPRPAGREQQLGYQHSQRGGFSRADAGNNGSAHQDTQRFPPQQDPAREHNDHGGDHQSRGINGPKQEGYRRRGHDRD